MLGTVVRICAAGRLRPVFPTHPERGHGQRGQGVAKYPSKKIAGVKPEVCSLFDMTSPLSVLSEFRRPMLSNSPSAHRHRQCPRGKNGRERLAEAIPAVGQVEVLGARVAACASPCKWKEG
jgi:hypothetical protein